MPDWFPLFRAANLCHVPPWEMAEMAPHWMNYALATENAIQEARSKLEEKAAKKRDPNARRRRR